jgi:hypothetical protein
MDSEPLKRCPCAIINEWPYSNECVMLYNTMSDGMLPYEGGLFNQPATIIDIYQLMKQQFALEQYS